jgi:short-subunit dehydrogenase
MKNAFVTGTSGGLGLCLCRALLRRGYRVAMFSRDGDRLAQAAASLASQGTVMALEGDVTDAARVAESVRQVEDAWGPIDLAIANAGIRGATRVPDFPLETAVRLMETNYFGMLSLFHAVLPGMVRRRAGCFVGIASIAGVRCLAGGSGYGASKAAMQSFLDTTRLDVRRFGLQVVTVNPWFVRTQPDDDRIPRPMQVEPEWAAERIVRGIEAGRTQVEFPLVPSLAWKALRLLPNALFVRIFGPKQ